VFTLENQQLSSWHCFSTPKKRTRWLELSSGIGEAQLILDDPGVVTCQGHLYFQVRIILNLHIVRSSETFSSKILLDFKVIALLNVCVLKIPYA